MRKKENEKRFKEILMATHRPEIDYVLEQLTMMKFFEMPASVTNHLNVEGGLCKHSLNVYDEAMGLREVQEIRHYASTMGTRYDG